MQSEIFIEVDQAARKEWLEVIARLWEAVDKPIDAARLKNYQRELAIVPLGLLEKAVSRCIRENTFSNVPPIGKVWEAVTHELGNPHDITQALENWAESGWNRCVVNFAEV